MAGYETTASNVESTVLPVNVVVKSDAFELPAHPLATTTTEATIPAVLVNLTRPDCPDGDGFASQEESAERRRVASIRLLTPLISEEPVTTMSRCRLLREISQGRGAGDSAAHHLDRKDLVGIFVDPSSGAPAEL